MVDNADDTTRETILAASTAVKLASNPDSDTESSKDESPVKTIAGADVELAQLPDEEFWSHDTSPAPELFFEESDDIPDSATMANSTPSMNGVQRAGSEHSDAAEPDSPVADDTTASLPVSDAFIDLAANVIVFLVVSRDNYNSDSQEYTPHFEKAVDIFGADQFVREPGRPRDVLGLRTYFYESAQRAGLPGPIFRWLQGMPMDTEFFYPSMSLDDTVEELANRGMF
jgi:hypothetical protein